MLGRLFDVYVPFEEMQEDTLGFPPILLVVALLILAAAIIFIVYKVKHNKQPTVPEDEPTSGDPEEP